MIYIFGILVALVIALGGVASCEHKKVQSLEARIEANKIEAQRLMDGALAKNAAKEKADQAYAITLQGDYDAKLKTLADTNRKYAGRLRDPGRNSGACPATQASSNPGIPQDPATGSELSSEAGIFLRAEADRADVAATYAASCRAKVINDLKGTP